MSAKCEFLPLYKTFQDSVLRFTEVLVIFVASSPQSVSVNDLVSRTQRTEGDILELVELLHQFELIKPHDGALGLWRLACDKSAITLDDVLTSALHTFGFEPFCAASKLESIDAFLTSAFMSVGQNVGKTLRQFSLDRVPRTSGVPMNRIAKAYAFS